MYMHHFMSAPFFPGFWLGDFIFGSILLLLLTWTLVWKGLALWHSARNAQKVWFIVFLIPINTLGILEIVYLVWFRTKEPYTPSLFSRPATQASPESSEAKPA